MWTRHPSPTRDLPVNRRISMPTQEGSTQHASVVQGEQSRAETQGRSHRKAPHNSDTKPRQRGKIGFVRKLGNKLHNSLHHLSTVVSIAFVVAASIALAWGIRQHVLKSPRFAVKTIRVQGVARRTVEQVSKTAAIAVGDNIFALDTERTRIRLLQDPWIQTAQVQRNLPSTITISVTEREAAAVVAVDADLYLCTHNGEIFKKLELEDPAGLVVISGISAAQLAADRGVVQTRLRSALELISQYETRGPSKQYPAQQVYLEPDGTTRMVVGTDALVLEMGRAPYRAKVLRAARVLHEVRKQKAQASIVFLDNEAHPERVVVRMR